MSGGKGAKASALARLCATVACAAVMVSHSAMAAS
jgi:hypothetical protein